MKICSSWISNQDQQIVIPLRSCSAYRGYPADPDHEKEARNSKRFFSNFLNFKKYYLKRTTSSVSAIPCAASSALWWSLSLDYHSFFQSSRLAIKLKALVLGQQIKDHLIISHPYSLPFKLRTVFPHRHRSYQHRYHYQGSPRRLWFLSTRRCPRIFRLSRHWPNLLPHKRLLHMSSMYGQQGYG